MVLHKVGVMLECVTQRVEERCFESAETVVKFGNVWMGKGERVGVALLCVAVDDGSARVGKSHDLGALVKRFACRVVNGLSDDFHVFGTMHHDDLGVAAADEQA